MIEAPGAGDAAKRAAAEAAVAEVRDGMIVGLGTGSTAAHAIAALGRLVTGGMRVTAVATSDRTAVAARAAGVEIVDLARMARIDLAIDGVDEIDDDLRAIKGAGAAMLRERIVAQAADRMVAIADASKPVATLGLRHPVPVEVAAMAQGLVAARVAGIGGVATLRQEGGTAVLTDGGNPILDCRFGAIADPAGLSAALSEIAGVLGHGLFVREIDALYVGDGRTVVRRERRGELR